MLRGCPLPPPPSKQEGSILDKRSILFSISLSFFQEKLPNFSCVFLYNCFSHMSTCRYFAGDILAYLFYVWYCLMKDSPQIFHEYCFLRKFSVRFAGLLGFPWLVETLDDSQCGFESYQQRFETHIHSCLPCIAFVSIFSIPNCNFILKLKQKSEENYYTGCPKSVHILNWVKSGSINPKTSV